MKSVPFFSIIARFTLDGFVLFSLRIVEKILCPCQSINSKTICHFSYHCFWLSRSRGRVTLRKFSSGLLRCFFFNFGQKIVSCVLSKPVYSLGTMEIDILMVEMSKLNAEESVAFPQIVPAVGIPLWKMGHWFWCLSRRSLFRQRLIRFKKCSNLSDQLVNKLKSDVKVGPLKGELLS